MALCRDIDILEVKIVTDRLILRPTSLFDLDPIFRNFDGRVTRFMFPSPAISSVETASFITDSIDAMLDRTNLHLTILHSDPKDQLAGCAGLHHTESRTPEFGIWLVEGSQGMGLGLEPVAAVCNWVADEVECDYIRYPVDRANGSSRNIPESLGAQSKTSTTGSHRPAGS
jgi:RimJ/RimL family protein N-acetyltransferase